MLLALTLGGTASTALAGKTIVLTDDQLDIGLTAAPLWVENRLLEEQILELKLQGQLGSLLPVSPGPGSEPTRRIDVTLGPMTRGPTNMPQGPTNMPQGPTPTALSSWAPFLHSR